MFPVMVVLERKNKKVCVPSLHFAVLGIFMATRGIQNSVHSPIWGIENYYFAKSKTKTKMKIFTDSKKLSIS